MLERGSPVAVLIGRWGMALTLVIDAVLLGPSSAISPTCFRTGSLVWSSMSWGKG